MSKNLHLPTLYHVMNDIVKNINSQLETVENVSEDKKNQELGVLYGLRISAASVNNAIQEAGGIPVRYN